MTDPISRQTMARATSIHHQFQTDRVAQFHCMPDLIRRLRFLFLFLLASACTAQAPQDSDNRFWTMANGRRSEVKLKLIEQSENSVKLERQDNGKAITLSISSLSKADQSYLASRVRGCESFCGSFSKWQLDAVPRAECQWNESV